ncbi:hypothetical protein [Cerasicoccus maritimus]|uniref:hypothetical protein n=1 Tax=Cerasicoccus maritimus TaxID=490089 RepID=UPI00285295A3|nr:hypothetical protein [Cerasicoccus maritimus]
MNRLVEQCNLSEFEADVSFLKRLLLELYERTSCEVHDDVLRFSFELEQKYDYVKDCMLFLLIIGGTLPTQTRIYDFEGTDSIEKFIKNLYFTHCIEGVA